MSWKAGATSGRRQGLSPTCCVARADHWRAWHDVDRNLSALAGHMHRAGARVHAAAAEGPLAPVICCADPSCGMRPGLAARCMPCSTAPSGAARMLTLLGQAWASKRAHACPQVCGAAVVGAAGAGAAPAAAAAAMRIRACALPGFAGAARAAGSGRRRQRGGPAPPSVLAARGRAVGALRHGAPPAAHMPKLFI